MKLTPHKARLSPKLARFLWGCRTKARYADQKTAARELKHATLRGETGMEIYECSFCNGWHLGHPIKEKK